NRLIGLWRNPAGAGICAKPGTKIQHGPASEGDRDPAWRARRRHSRAGSGRNPGAGMGPGKNRKSLAGNSGKALTLVAMSRHILFAVIGVLILASLANAQAAPDFNKARDEAVKFLSELVKVDTSNPPGHEAQAAEYIKSVLAAEGIPSQIYESAPGRGNLVARLKGNGKKQPLLLMGHLDV